MSQQGILGGLDPNRKLEVSGGQGLRVLFERRRMSGDRRERPGVGGGRRGPEPGRAEVARFDEAPAETTDMLLLAAGDAPIELDVGPTRRVEPQRELLMIRSGVLDELSAGLPAVSAVVVEVLDLRRLRHDGRARAKALPHEPRLLTGPREATWVEVDLNEVPGAVFVGDAIGVVLHRPVGDALRVQWLHRAPEDILHGARPGERIRLERPDKLTRPGPWFIAGHDMTPPAGALPAPK